MLLYGEERKTTLGKPELAGQLEKRMFKRY